MPQRALLAIGGALAALLLLACGDDRLAPEEYFPRVQAIADDLIETIYDEMVALHATDPDLGEQGFVDAMRSYFARYGTAFDEAADGFSNLSPPDDAAAAHEDALAEMRTLADALQDISRRLAGTATFEEVRAALDAPGPLPESETVFLASEGLERIAAEAGQSFDWGRAAEPIIEAMTSYNEVLRAIADDLDEDINALISTFVEAEQEAGEDTDALTEAIAAYFGDVAARYDAAAVEVETLAPPDLLRNLHDLGLENFRSIADWTREMGRRVDAAADYDEVRDIIIEYSEDLDEMDDIPETVPESFGQPPRFAAACEAIGRVVARIGFPLGFVCGGGG